MNLKVSIIMLQLAPTPISHKDFVLSISIVNNYQSHKMSTSVFSFLFTISDIFGIQDALQLTKQNKTKTKDATPPELKYHNILEWFENLKKRINRNYNKETN